MASELRLIDAADFVAFIRTEQFANIGNLVNSSTELYFKPDTIKFGLSGDVNLQWGGTPSVSLDMEFHHMRVNVYFRLLLDALHAGIEIDYITFDEGSADPDQNTQRLIEAIANAGWRRCAARRRQQRRRRYRACTATDRAEHRSTASLGQDYAPRELLQPEFRAPSGLACNFSTLSRAHNSWLAVRQTAVAGNIANANTPGFRAQDVQPFEMALEQARLAMAATQPGHLASGPPDAPATELRRGDPGRSRTRATTSAWSRSCSRPARSIAPSGSIPASPRRSIA